MTGTQFATPNPTVGIARVLKPWPGFESFYDGAPARRSTSVAVPVPFFEWTGGEPPKSPRAPKAGTPGYDPNLARFIPVPMGSRLQLAIPTFTQVAEGLTVPVVYRYSIVWRWSSEEAYIQKNAPRYSIPNLLPGAPDGVSPRVAILAAQQTVQYLSTEPTGYAGDANFALRSLQYDTYGPPGQVARPYLDSSSDTAVFMQGIVDSSYPFFNSAPYVLTEPFVCRADEMWLQAERIPGQPLEGDTWDFSGTDLQFSNLFGTQDGTHKNYATAGIYLFSIASGAAP